MAKNKSKAFFYMGSWYHRTKFLRKDFSIGYSKKGGFKTQKEAEESYERMRKEFEENKRKWNPCTDQNILLADYLNYWFNRVHVPTVDSATRMVEEITLNYYVLPQVDDLPLKLCNTGYFDRLLKAASLHTKSAGNRCRELLNTAMRNAVQEGYLAENPIEFTKHYPKEKHNATILTKDEIRRLLFEMRSSNWFLETLLALFCGLRRGEIMGLKFSDFDTGNETVTISRQVSEEYIFDDNGLRIGHRAAEKPPKTENSYRTMRIPKVIFEELEIRRKKIIKDKENQGSVYHDHGYISCKDNGEPHTLPSFYGALKRACNRAGVPQVSVHDLRHMYATILLEQGVSLVKISGLLGHASIHTTFEHYCHVMEDDRRITGYLNKTFKSRKADL